MHLFLFHAVANQFIRWQIPEKESSHKLRLHGTNIITLLLRSDQILSHVQRAPVPKSNKWFDRVHLAHFIAFPSLPPPPYYLYLFVVVFAAHCASTYFSPCAHCWHFMHANLYPCRCRFDIAAICCFLHFRFLCSVFAHLPSFSIPLESWLHCITLLEQ